MEDNHDRRSLGLDLIEELMVLAQKYRVSHVKWKDLEITMDPSAYQKELSKEQLESLLSSYRKTADLEDKEFEQTLYYSSESV